MAATSPWPRYRADQTYEWNYHHAPTAVVVDVPPIPGNWNFCGLSVGSPLGVAAGPLLNGRWCLYYASLGFDVLTYKTVRSTARACFPAPNLQPVRCGSLFGHERAVLAEPTMSGSWAVSFGMPSQCPDVWRADIEETRRALPPAKILCVSVVGSVQPDWSLERLAEDYAVCAQWALASGADAIEANLSCPNVATCDGQLYQQPQDAAVVAAALRRSLGTKPLILKVGHLVDERPMAELLDAVAPFADAVSMTNSIALPVQNTDGQWLFDGQKRGICGRATLEASLAQTRLAAQVVQRRGWRLRIIGVGGAATAGDVRGYLDAGAHAVHLATAAMVAPDVALRIRRDW